MTSEADTQARRVLVLRSLPLDSDSRTTKMIQAYREAGYAVHVLAWNRGKSGKSDPVVTYYEGQGKIGTKWKNLVYLIGWFFFLATQMIRRRHDYAILHVIDFDTAIVGVPMGRLLGKLIIFDGYDHFGSIRENPWARSFFDKLERGLIRASDVATLPSRQRVDQYAIRDLDPVIISNIPDEMPSAKPEEIPDPARPLTIVYVGTLQAKHRGLEYLSLICVRYPHIRVVIGGLGELEEKFVRDARALENLNFLGRLDYDDALRTMAAADCLYGPYLLTVDYHRYASPNKMYEHVLLGKPLITNHGTPVADFVRENRTGYVFDGTEAGLDQLVATLTRADCERVGQHARKIWDDELQFQRQRELTHFFGEVESASRTRDERTAA